MNDIRHGMRIAALESRREVRELENATLSRQIEAPLTTDLARQIAMSRRIAVLSEWAEVVEQLRVLRCV